MVDLETMSTGPGAAIIQIGAVTFDPTGDYVDVTGGFEKNVSLDSCIRAGLAIDESTVAWWMQQSDMARTAVMTEPRSLRDALGDLTYWLGFVNMLEPDITLWSHGLAFDVPILENAYQALGFRAPWGHRVGRDTRTLFWLAGERGWSAPNHVVAHTGLADAVAQAQDVQSAYRILNREIVKSPRAPYCKE
jgi:exodeoxyribonuclease VIII